MAKIQKIPQVVSYDIIEKVFLSTWKIIFQALEYMFQALEYIFQVLEYLFQDLEYDLALGEI